MTKTMAGKNVLVTGGGQGIGRAMVDVFVNAGAKVALNDIRMSDTVKKAVEETGAIPLIGDVSDFDTMNRLIHDFESNHGGFDVLVANAAGMTMVPFFEQPEAEWWEQVNINLTGHLNCVKQVLPGMKMRRNGTIVLLSSYFGAVGWKNASGYAASKSALMALGQHLAREYKSYGINIGILLPGIIRTPQLNIDAQDLGVSYDEVCEIYAKDIPLGRLGEPREVAELALFMAGEGGKALSGRFVQVNGAEYRATPYYID